MKKIGISDFCEIKSLSGVSLSPDGKKAAFVVKQPDLDRDCYDTHIWLWENGAVKRLSGGGKEGSFTWLDDETILFPGDRLEKYKDKGPYTVFNRLSIRGGEAEEFFALPFGAGLPRPLADGRFLLTGTYDPRRFVADDPTGQLREKTREELEADKRYEIFDELPFWKNGQGVTNKCRSRLYLCTSAGESTALTPPLMEVWHFEYAAQRQEILVVGEEYRDKSGQKPGVYLYGLDGSCREILAAGQMDIATVQFLGEDFLLAATDGQKYGTSQTPTFYLLKRDGSLSVLADLEPSLDCAVSSDCAAGGRSFLMDGDTALYLENRGFNDVLMALDTRTGEAAQISPALPGRVDGFDRKNGVTVYTAMRENGLQELYLLTDGVERQLTNFNGAFLQSHSCCPLHYRPFTDSEGVQIDGWVIEPLGYDPQERYPAILDVHGGPRGAYGTVFFHEMQYWANEGYFVFFCNPHGSSGRGDEFADIYGEQYGVRDYRDIMEFTDHVLSQYPQIDKARLGMTGGSYGGFMANWIIGHTHRFAAVASQRSISNYFSKCLTTDIGYYHNLSAIEASPWENPAQLWEHSPLKYADRAKTPTLFIHSDQDYRCWMAEGLQMFTALKMHGVPARMCLFHGENHELSRSGKPQNRVKRLEEITSWFDQWLGKEKA